MSAPSLDCREYEAMQRRGGRPYSLGHRIMYDTPLTLMTRSGKAASQYAILEAGFGIGYGLDRMVETGVIGRYVGFEPDKDSFAYVQGRHGKRAEIALHHAPFAYDGETFAAEFDHTFCIEVIEHVPPAGHQGFICDLRQATKGTLWFSTPDKARSDHGVRTAVEWTRFLKAGGFADVTHHADQWTDLWCCQ